MRRGVLLLGLVVAGCASPRLFPVCFYNDQPSQKTANEYYLPRLQSVLRGIVNESRQVDVISTPDGRWLVARTTKWEHDAVAIVWPRIGCIGTATDSAGVMREADCVSYVNGFLKNGNYLDFGVVKDVGGIEVWSEAPDNRAVVRCQSVRVEE